MSACRGAGEIPRFMYDRPPMRSRFGLENDMRIPSRSSNSASYPLSPLTDDPFPHQRAISAIQQPLQIRQLLGVFLGPKGVDNRIDSAVHDALQRIIFLIALKPVVRHTVLRKVVRPDFG